MVEGKIRIAYDGEALQKGTMDVEQFAPALMAFGKLVQRVNTVIGNDYPVRVLLKADDIHKGSFDIQLEVITTFLTQAKLFIQNAEDSGLKALLDILVYGVTFGGTLFTVIKKIRNRKITGAEKDGNDNIKIIIDSNEEIVIQKELYLVLVDAEVRENVAKIIAPLKNEGISSFTFRKPDNPQDKVPIEQVTKEDVEFFNMPKLAEEAVEDVVSVQEMIFSIVSVVFDENQKWRFTDGEATFWAKIEDEDFWKLVENGELSFRKGDRLRVQYTTVQHLESNGSITLTKTINKVLEHMKRARQIALDFKKE